MATSPNILTGLPTPRSPLDLWGCSEFLRPGLLGFIVHSPFFTFCPSSTPPGLFQVPSIRIPVRFTDNIDELWSQSVRRIVHCKRLKLLGHPTSPYVTRERMTLLSHASMPRWKLFTCHLSASFHVCAIFITTVPALHQLCCGWAITVRGPMLSP